MTTIAPTNTRDSQSEVLDAIDALLSRSNAIQIATLGGPYTPWILGAYFTASRTEAALQLQLMVELSGKTMKNLRADPRVAFSVSENDATQDFLQGAGRAHVLPDDAAPTIVGALVAKMPEYKLYTPCAPVIIDVSELFLTSFARGWMPPRRLTYP